MLEKNEEIVFKIILQKNIVKYGDLKYVATLKDYIRMALIFGECF